MTARKGNLMPAPTRRQMAPPNLDTLRESPSWSAAIAVLRLSRRETDIVQCLLSLADDEESIALCLGISKHTVHTHLERLYRKLNVTSRCQLITRVFFAYLGADAAAMSGDVDSRSS